MKELALSDGSMKGNKVLMMAVLISLGLVVPAMAQVKIAVVDLNQVFNNYERTKETQAKLQKEVDEINAELDGMRNDLEAQKKALDALQAEINDPAISDAAKEEKRQLGGKKVQEYRELEQKIMQTKALHERYMAERTRRMRTEVVADIRAAVERAAAAKNVDFVVDQSGLSANGVPVFIFVNKNVPDLTEDVTKDLNAKFKPKG